LSCGLLVMSLGPTGTVLANISKLWLNTRDHLTLLEQLLWYAMLTMPKTTPASILM